MQTESCDIGLIGLAVMGQNLVLNMNDHGYRVAVFNRTVSKVDDFINNEAKGTKVVGAHSIPELVQALKDQVGDELQIWGSGKLLETLLQHELVDRFRLMVYPLVLGSGRRLFNAGVLPTTMRPVAVTVTDLGVVIGTYEPAGRVRQGTM